MRAKSIRSVTGESCIWKKSGNIRGLFSSGNKGISLNHCEVKWKEGFPVLIDRNSTYGTYFGNGQKLEPNVPYKLRDHVKFYLGSSENEFTIHIK